MKKATSLSYNMNKYPVLFCKSQSYNDFEKLILKGQQLHLSFGEYSKKSNNTKENRKKVITYMYQKIYSKL